MKIKFAWKRVQSSLPNLNVLYVEGVFMGWNNTKTGAQKLLEKVLVGA